MKDVVGYEGLYAVTEDGRIWAYPKLSRLQGRWMKICSDRSGYQYVCLFKDGQRKNVKIHRMVAEAYLPKNGKPHVNHKDGKKHNNALENLEWCTPKENKIHAFATGLTKMHPSQIEASRRNITMYNLSKGNRHVQSHTV